MYRDTFQKYRGQGSIWLSWKNDRIQLRRGGQNRVDLSFCVLPCFAVLGGPKIPKTARKVSLPHPFYVPQMLVKTRVWEQCPQRTGKRQIDPILPICKASGAFLLTVVLWSFFAYNWSFFAYGWSFFACSVKVPLISTWMDCEQRFPTVSRKAPTVSKKKKRGPFPRHFLDLVQFRRIF